MSAGHPFSTRRGRRRREARLRLDDRLCVMCRSIGVIAEAVTVDHIVALQDGGEPFDLNNMRSLCLPCHKQRHGAWPKVRVDPETGLPIGGGHWWSE
jgi:5-methylcytosine-specific restriction endonuclease McrA